MDGSSLKRLSPEIRMYIYQFAFTETSVDVFYNPLTQSKVTMEPQPGHKFCTLAKTCRQLRAECSGLFYSCNTFDVYLNKLRSYPYKSAAGGLDMVARLEELNLQTGPKRLTPRKYALSPLTRFMDSFSEDKLLRLRIVPHIGIYPISNLSTSGMPWLLYICSTYIRGSSPGSPIHRCNPVKFTLVYYPGTMASHVDFTVDCYNIKKSLGRIIATLEEIAAQQSEGQTSLAKAVQTLTGWKALNWDNEKEWSDLTWSTN